MSDVLKQEVLVEYFDKEIFVQKTAFQINKDLNGLSDYKVDPDFNQAQEKSLDHFLDLLQTALLDLHEKNLLQQFVYAVDLPENQYLKTLADVDLKELAYLILRREAKKVYLKMRFSGSEAGTGTAKNI